MTEDSAAPSAHIIRRASILWQQGAADFRAAKVARRNGDGLQSSLLSLQSAVNSLSAVCHLNGHFQLPMGDLPGLLHLCEGADVRFAGLRCPGLEESMESNPFAPQRDAAQEATLGRTCLAEATQVRKLVKSYLKGNRERFFRP